MTRPCEHLEYEAEVTFDRLVDEETETTMVGLHCAVKARCAGCGAPVIWHVPNVGLLADRPTVDPIGQELRVPARLAVHPSDFGLQLPGFSVTAHQPTNPN